MIGKVIRGNRLQGVLRYLYGPGEYNEHVNPHIVVGFRPAEDLEPGLRPDGRRDFRALDELMTEPLAALPDAPREAVWHYPIRAHPDDPILTDEEWADIARQVMNATGLAPDGDDAAVRWLAVRHADDHIHIVATLARQDGQRPNIHRDAIKARSALRSIEDQYGLTRTAPADRTAAKRPSRAETEKSFREHLAEPPRVTLRRHVLTCAAGARTETEFFDRLAEEGVLVHKRMSTQNPGQITGYAVALPNNRSSTGTPIFYSGGKLAADLTLPKLRHRWQSPPDSRSSHTPSRRPISGRVLSRRSAMAYLRTAVRKAADDSSTDADFFERLTRAGIDVRLRYSIQDPAQITGYSVTLPGHSGSDGQPYWYSGGRLADDLTLPRLRNTWHQPTRTPGVPLSPEELQAYYDDATRAARYATEQIRRHGLGSTQANDALWAASDLLHVTARALGDPHLKRAADLYDRAARPPHARFPSPTPAGEALRTASRLLALSGLIGDQGTINTLLLIIALTALLETIADLHTHQRRLPQAQAARSASGQLCFANPHDQRSSGPGYLAEINTIGVTASEASAHRPGQLEGRASSTGRTAMRQIKNSKSR